VELSIGVGASVVGSPGAQLSYGRGEEHVGENIQMRLNVPQ
jgi:hypothetical protein